MKDIILKCTKCDLFKNQCPLLDKKISCDIMIVGLSAKKVNDIVNNVPLENNTNSGKIIEDIEKKLNKYSFYKTNLVKCLPLNENNKLRYPTYDEMKLCFNNLNIEIKFLKPKIIILLGNIVYDNFIKFNKEQLNYFKIKHPSYIYVYKKKEINNYIDDVINLINNNISN